MKTTKEMIEIMQAYERGEQIQLLNIDGNWEDKDNPAWNWEKCDYRVKPKPKYVLPFDTPEEFLASKKKHGNTIKRIEDGMIYQAYVDEKGFLLLKANRERIISLENLFGKYKFADGTPCGKEVNE